MTGNYSNPSQDDNRREGAGGIERPSGPQGPVSNDALTHGEHVQQASLAAQYEPDPYDLQRFLDAQSRDFDVARDELKAGRKQSHWIWYMFPQAAGLGHSAMAQHYSIVSIDEARAYLDHPILGPRLVELTSIVNGLAGTDANAIFGSPDDMKFRSSMTLFLLASEGRGSEGYAAAFRRALERYQGGLLDNATMRLLRL
ncbi:DUF1810 domain-containing protein [Robbsia sp. KACC 23696]|uniref:DUF1810 domain-containing protein n=1 Tax=Robbsia sp. KACC 23696 TaxID=3149231 RepID=UPI00325AB719